MREYLKAHLGQVVHLRGRLTAIGASPGPGYLIYCIKPVVAAKRNLPVCDHLWVIWYREAAKLGDWIEFSGRVIRYARDILGEPINHSMEFEQYYDYCLKPTMSFKVIK